MFTLSEEPILREQLMAALENERAGALVTFEGWVRNHNEGKKVQSLEYQVYPALAQKEGERILEDACHRFNLHQVICVHRFGHLNLGEAAVWVGATASHRDEAFKAARFVIDQLKLRLPIWKKEHYVDQPAEWVFCRDHHTHVHFEESEYYGKQTKLVDQAKLKSARVAVIGAGGLGCPVLTGLVSAGVGHIDVIDFDRVSISNLHRQPLYAVSDVGEKKSVVAQNKLSALNPFIRVKAHDVKLDARNAEELLQNHDLVLDCTDNLDTKFLVHDVCYKLRIPVVAASVYQYEGQIRTFVPELQNGCLRCQYDQTPDDSQLGNCNDFGVLGANVAVVGSLQASEALQFLLYSENQTSESTLYFHSKDLSQMRVKNIKREACPTCAGDVTLESDDLEVALNEVTQDHELVDIRDLDDSCIKTFRSSPKKVVFYCHRGVRSKRLVRQERAHGYSHVYSLKGGACSL